MPLNTLHCTGLPPEQRTVGCMTPTAPRVSSLDWHSDFALEKPAVLYRPYIMVCPQRGV